MDKPQAHSSFKPFAAKLIVESDNFGRVRIRGAETDYYLCVRRSGHFVGRKVVLTVYSYFMILCPKCLQSAVYSLLMVGLKAWEPNEFAFKLFQVLCAGML